MLAGVRPLGCLLCVLAAVDPVLAGDAVIPRFRDPQRKTKFEAAFPKIEEIFERFRTQRNVPGMSYGLIVDGELVLVKGSGVADREAGTAATPRYRVSHRVP